MFKNAVSVGGGKSFEKALTTKILHKYKDGELCDRATDPTCKGLAFAKAQSASDRRARDTTPQRCEKCERGHKNEAWSPRRTDGHGFKRNS